MIDRKNRVAHRLISSLCAVALLWTGVAVPMTAIAVEAPHNILIVLRDGSVVRGVLLHRMPTAYLVQSGGVDRVVPFDQVTDLQDLGEAVDATPQPAPAPAPIPATAAPTAVAPAPVYVAPPPTYVAPPPTYVAPTPPVAQPSGSSDNDPRPEVVGGGMIGGGWAMFGVGTLGAIVFAGAAASAAADQINCAYSYSYTSTNTCKTTSSSDADTYTLAMYGFSALATAGLVIAIVGHVKRGVSKGKLREWEERHGVRESTLRPAAEPIYADLRLQDGEAPSTVLAPFVTRDGGLGLALGGRF